MWNANLDEWCPSCCIHRCINLHNFPLRLRAHGWDLKNRVWYVKEIKENDQYEESRQSNATLQTEIWDIVIDRFHLSAKHFQGMAWHQECCLYQHLISEQSPWTTQCQNNKQITDVGLKVIFTSICWLSRVTNFMQILVISPGQYTFIPVWNKMETEPSKSTLVIEDDHNAYLVEPDTHWQSEISTVET